MISKFFKRKKMSTTADLHIPHLITMDSEYLLHAKKMIKNNDPSLKPAFDKLMHDAEIALTIPCETVTNKKILPPSGNKHDYMSLAPYWWPDPSKPDGLPYILHDGQFNPSSKNGDTDSVRMQQMCMSTQLLSLAYIFSGDKRYARKTADIIRTWFLSTKTKMNPHLNYGQAIMGKTPGRGIGLIDTRNLWMAIDAALIISHSRIFTKSELEQLRSWFKKFTRWMLTSDIATEEFNQHNNHGTFFDMQLACYALFIGDKDLAKKTVKRGVDLRISSQISNDGKQHAELERTTPFHYVAFNLDAMTNIARYGEHTGIKVWNAREKTRGLRNGINYMAKYSLTPETWPHAELREMENELALPILLKAERAYHDGIYGSIAEQLPEKILDAHEYKALYESLDQPHPTTKTSIDRLIWPIVKK